MKFLCFDGAYLIGTDGFDLSNSPYSHVFPLQNARLIFNIHTLTHGTIFAEYMMNDIPS